MSWIEPPEEEGAAARFRTVLCCAGRRCEPLALFAQKGFVSYRAGLAQQEGAIACRRVVISCASAHHMVGLVRLIMVGRAV